MEINWCNPIKITIHCFIKNEDGEVTLAEYKFGMTFRTSDTVVSIVRTIEETAQELAKEDGIEILDEETSERISFTMDKIKVIHS